MLCGTSLGCALHGSSEVLSGTGPSGFSAWSRASFHSAGWDWLSRLCYNSPQSFLSRPLRSLLKRSLHRPLSLVLFLWESKQTSETRFCSPMKWTCYRIKSKELFTGQNMEKRHIKRDEKTVRSEVIPGYQLTCGGPPKSWVQINV